MKYAVRYIHGHCALYLNSADTFEEAAHAAKDLLTEGIDIDYIDICQYDNENNPYVYKHIAFLRDIDFKDIYNILTTKNPLVS